ncbi:Hsp20/alpha crystallin family protein [Geobacter sp.]|uniref:Hsp20/alpha crystallin family protein n=1 Tax=Geobacter sp. TaxID=46610 RepID=UPI001AD3A43C|nr:Hsp20/alpha crystallin family protein [Geobacter sp.]CAG0959536.1 Spore protein SP21 [Geobacteraceae bacterium]
MAVIPKEPLDWLSLLHLQMDEVFDYIARTGGGERWGECEYLPAVDIFETLDEFAVEFELPGIEQSDLSLKLCCNMLILEGVKRDDTRDGVSYRCLERRFGRFCRTVEIPPTVDLGAVKACFRQGVLVVTFPRLSDRGKIIREIPIEQGDDNGRD